MIKKNKIKLDFAYSFVSYILPVFVIQFALQPLIANNATSESNAIFITCYSLIKMCVTVFIAPLANLRLLDKHRCEEDNALNESYNLLLISIIAIMSCIVFITLRVVGISSFNNILYSVIITILISIHDYYSIYFRIILNYKLIFVDSLLLVIGYMLGVAFFSSMSINWYSIFIIAYSLSTLYVTFNNRLISLSLSFKKVPEIMKRYLILCSSNLLNCSTLYCDRLMIYPLLGALSLSIYNACSTTGKVISLINIPFKNILLSYVVNEKKIELKLKIKNIIWCLVASTLLFFVLYYISVKLCEILYNKYSENNEVYIFLILLSMYFETVLGVAKTLLLRFADSILQVYLSFIKLFIYLSIIFVSIFYYECSLIFFCLAICISNFICMVVSVFQANRFLHISIY